MTAQELDALRSKPIIQLTSEEIAKLDDQEQSWVIAQLARWEAQDRKSA